MSQYIVNLILDTVFRSPIPFKLSLHTTRFPSLSHSCSLQYIYMLMPRWNAVYTLVETPHGNASTQYDVSQSWSQHKRKRKLKLKHKHIPPFLLEILDFQPPMNINRFNHLITHPPTHPPTHSLTHCRNLNSGFANSNSFLLIFLLDL